MFRQKLRWHWVPIESPMTGSGTPDSNFCRDGVEGWVEFKLARGWVATLRPMQIGWLLRRTREGGRCFVAVRQILTSGGDVLYLYSGDQAPEVARAGGMRTAVPLGSWSGGPSAWDWAGIGRCLLAPLLERGGRGAALPPELSGASPRSTSAL